MLLKPIHSLKEILVTTNVIIMSYTPMSSIQDFEDATEAVREFEFLYEEKTGNKWKNRNDFKKVRL